VLSCCAACRQGWLRVVYTAVFHSVLRHQVDALGFPEPYVYEAVEDPHGLLQVVSVAFRLLEKPVDTEPDIEDAQIIEAWRSHPPACRCARFPVAFNELSSKSEEELRELLDNFKRRYKEVDLARRVAANEQVSVRVRPAHALRVWDDRSVLMTVHASVHAAPRSDRPFVQTPPCKSVRRVER